MKTVLVTNIRLPPGGWDFVSFFESADQVTWSLVTVFGLDAPCPREWLPYYKLQVDDDSKWLRCVLTDGDDNTYALGVFSTEGLNVSVDDVQTQSGMVLGSSDIAKTNALIVSSELAVFSAIGKDPLWVFPPRAFGFARSLVISNVVAYLSTEVGLRSKSTTLGAFSHSEVYETTPGLTISPEAASTLRRLVYGKNMASARIDAPIVQEWYILSRYQRDYVNSRGSGFSFLTGEGPPPEGGGVGEIYYDQASGEIWRWIG